MNRQIQTIDPRAQVQTAGLMIEDVYDQAIAWGAAVTFSVMGILMICSILGFALWNRN